MKKEKIKTKPDNHDLSHHPYCIMCDDSGCKYCFKTNPNLEGGE